MITEEEISHQNNNIFDLSHPIVLVPPSCVPHVTESELGQFSVTNRHYRHTQKVV